MLNKSIKIITLLIFAQFWSGIVGLVIFALRESHLKWLLNREKEGYDPSEHPLAESNDIFAGITLVQDYEIDIYFVENWVDERLNHSRNGCIHFNDWQHVRRLWRPDSYLANAKQANYIDVTVPNHVLQVCNHGRIRFSTRVSAKVACNMNLKMYPFDHQTCDLRILTYGNNITQVSLYWAKQHAIRVNTKIVESDLRLNHTTATICNGRFAEGNYSCLLGQFHFQRSIAHHMLQIFAPTAAIVCISWISFWIDPLSVPGRVGLCVTTLLTLATQAAGFSQHLPAVGYAKALDIWMSVCLIYLFGALIEFTVVNMFMRRLQGKRIKLTPAKKTSTNTPAFEAPFASQPDLMMVNSARNGIANSTIAHQRSSLAVCPQQIQSTFSSNNNNIEITNQFINNTQSAIIDEEVLIGDHNRKGSRSLYDNRLLWKARTLDRLSRILFPLTFVTFSVLFMAFCI